MTYTWNKDLETGNPMIDRQHKQLISCINDLLDACSQGKGRDKILETVKDIIAEMKTTGPTVALVAKVNTSIASWFINHIKREDTKVAKHVSQSS